MFVAVGVADRVVEPPLKLEGVVELFQLGQDDDETENDEEHHEQFPGVVVGRDVAVAHRAERDQNEPDGVEEVQLTVDQFDPVEETDPAVQRGGRRGGVWWGEGVGIDHSLASGILRSCCTTN